MNILLVEDEKRVADFISRGLKGECWSVQHAKDGETAISYLKDGEYDVVVLDLMLPGISGQDVCLKMRTRHDYTPVLMLTALDSTDERVAGLSLGADDYLAKPFDFEELIARINALVRRAQEFKSDRQSEHLTYEGICFNTASLVITVDDKEVDMTTLERDILNLFMSNVGKVFSRERILNVVWGDQKDPLTNIVDVYVGRLRKKLASYGRLIKTVRGLGYRFG